MTVLSLPRFLLRCAIALGFAQSFANAFLATTPAQVQKLTSLIPGRMRTNGSTSDQHHRYLRTHLSANSSGDTGPKNASTSNNEFSRTIQISRWFGAGGSGLSGGRGRKKSMSLSISATPEECHALAARFRLTNITALSAELAVQPALGERRDALGGGGSGADSECIEARGTVCAEVTQTCVRTNEAFDVSLEFSFDTILRAMASTSVRGKIESGSFSEGELAALEAASQLGNDRPRKNKKGGDRKSGAKRVRGGQPIDDMGMKQLSDILMEREVTDDIIEDETCFCTDGIVDCGEIVAQMFRSKLDPYPKKPGSEPVSYSFTF